MNKPVPIFTVCTDGKAHKLGAAVAPVSVAPPLPICASCNRNPYGCVCNAPDPEPEYFKPGLNRDPDSGWALAERSALGMPGAKA
jgi:hypothetical protein